MISIKGSVDLINLVIFSAVMILLSLTASFFLPQISINSNLSATINADTNQFRSYMAMRTFLDDTTIRSIREYPVSSEDRKTDIRRYIETRSEEVFCPLSRSYSFEISKDSIVNEGFGDKKYSNVRIASPSQDILHVDLGLGEMRPNGPEALGNNCLESDYSGGGSLG